MKVHYLEIVTSDVSAVCAACEAAHGLTFGRPTSIGGGQASSMDSQGGSCSP